MSDAEFDRQEADLRSIDPTNKYFDLVESDLIKVKVFHPYPMLSQQKALSLTELQSFLFRYPTETYISSHKLDGMSIEIVVRDDIFSASSRGDGEFGEDYSDEVRTILGQDMVEALIKLHYPLILRGECILSTKDFDELNAKLATEDKQPYSNKRNGVAGIFNNKADGYRYLQYVSIVVWEVLEPYNQSYSKGLEWLYELRMVLPVAPLYVITFSAFNPSLDWLAIESNCKQAALGREKCSYAMDGLVFRMDDRVMYDSLGRTAKFWRGSVAYKFPCQEGTIRIREIEWHPGSKDITPVAVFDPIFLSGANISRASLHSVKNMFDLGACKGANLVITRQGEVIPMLHAPAGGARFDNGILVQPEDVRKEIPWNCPVCKALLSLSSDFTHLFCTNITCSGKLSRRIEIFAKTLGIQFIGPGIADQLATCIDDPIRLLDCDWVVIASILGGGVTARIKAEVDRWRSRPVSLEGFIAALSLGRCGVTTVQQLFKEFGSEACLSGQADFTATRGVGPQYAAQLRIAFTKAAIIIKQVKAMGINFSISSSPDQKTETSVFKVFFCVTGEMSKKRADFISEMETYGWSFKSAVSSVCSYLVCNQPSDSGKSKKAQQLGIQVITEQQALDLVKSTTQI